MGFKVSRTVLVLDFTGTPYEGAEVRATSLPFGAALDVESLLGLSTEQEKAQAGAQQYQLFADNLVSWNLEREDDTPIPATMEGLRELDSTMAMFIYRAWYRAMTDVDEGSELGKDSGSGGISLAASLPMEPLSADRAS